MQVVLAMFRSDGDRRSFSLHKEMTVIGRREDCDLRIPLSEISRKHCRITREADTLRLEDLGSSNGTFHNGQRVQEAVVQPGDTIQVGSIAFVVQIDGTPADDDLHPVLAHNAVSNEGSSGAGTSLEAEDSAADISVGEGDDFDPMAVLDDSAIGDSVAGAAPDDAGIDMEESEHGQNAGA